MTVSVFLSDNMNNKVVTIDLDLLQVDSHYASWYCQELVIVSRFRQQFVSSWLQAV